LLSLEAMRVTETVEAKRSLLEGLMRNSHFDKSLRGPTGPAGQVNSVAFSSDGRTVAVAGSDGLHLWDAITGVSTSTPIETEFIVVGTAFSPMAVSWRPKIYAVA
jgi:WD40 repeat protein